MLHFINGRGRSPRLTVLAYDIRSPRRARQVRRVLDPLHHDKQYSVYEVVLRQAELRGLLAEIDLLCDFSEDLFAGWWPRDGVRLSRHKRRTTVEGVADVSTSNIHEAIHGAGNFMICYDITDPHALRQVARVIAPETSMVQRSVYWLRAHSEQLLRVVETCAEFLGDEDQLWIYPLRGSGDLWHVGETVQSIMPIATHRWELS